ncbi:MAG: hypothetical protein AAFX99_35240, partial [Myxococcota bacterium]
LRAVQQGLAAMPSLPEIWVGDFNALTREDYNASAWRDIVAVRKRNRWEAPQTAATEWMRKAGFIDCWRAAGCEGPVSTCRFDTRVDYIWASPDFLDQWALTQCIAVHSDASDHKLVRAQFRAQTSSL